MLKIGIIIFGVLLSIWGFYNTKQKSELIKSRKAFHLVDVLINGWGSGLGMFISGIICILIGVFAFFAK